MMIPGLVEGFCVFLYNSDILMIIYGRNVLNMGIVRELSQPNLSSIRNSGHGSLAIHTDW